MKTLKDFLVEATLHSDITALVSKYNNLKVGIRQKDDIVTLDKIVVPEDERDQGVGTKFMKELIKIADKNNLILALSPSSDFGGSKQRLVKFYKSLGFVENKGSNKDFRTKETFIKEPGNQS